MSKVVRSVGRAITGVVRGVTKAVSSVVKGVGRVVSRVARSPIGRVLLAAATIYFGGAAIMGAMKGAAAGSGFFGTISSALSGAGTGIANAWTGLTSATGAALGGNFAQAGQHLGAGIQGNLVASPNMTNLAALSTSGTSNIGLQAPSAAGGAPALNPTASINALQAPTNVGANLATTAPAAAPAAASGGMSPLAQYGLIQVAGNAIQGYGQQEALKAEQARQDRLAAADLARKDENWRTAYQFDDARDSGFNPNNPSNQPATPSYGTQFADGPALLQNGLVGNQMYPSTLTNSRFPTYNPAYSRFV